MIRFPLNYDEPKPKDRSLLSDIIGTVMLIVALILWGVVIYDQS